MKQFLLLGAGVALLAAAATTQSHTTAPTGHLTTSGGYYTNWPFVLVEGGRAQLGDPSIDKRARAVLGIDYRSTSYLTISATTGNGRTYSNLKLDLGHTDCSKMTTTWSTNYKGKGTAVYSAKTIIPTISNGKPKQVWGNAGSLKFTKPFLYNGKDDLLMDFTYTKGVHANGSTNPTSAYYSDGGRATVAIANFGPDQAGGAFIPKPPSGTGNGPFCNDSSHSVSVAAFSTLSGVVYGDTYTTVSLRGKLQIKAIESYFTAAGKPVIGVLTVNGSDKGANIGAACNLLHLNMTIPVLTSARTATTLATAWSGDHIPANTTLPLLSWFSGLQLYWQSAWTDSKTGRFSLTRAAKVTIPKKPGGYPAGCSIYQYFSRGTLRGPFVQNTTFVNCLERLRHK